MGVYKLRFLQEYSVKDEVGTVIKKDEIIEVDNEASRDRWLRRGVAELVESGKATTTMPKSKTVNKKA